jgi:hypothetical protein
LAVDPKVGFFIEPLPWPVSTILLLISLFRWLKIKLVYLLWIACTTADFHVLTIFAFRFAVMSSDAGDRIRIEDLLDSVADAVSALVMFASESKNDRRLLTSLRTGVTAVTEAVNFLVGEATVTVKLWREFGNTGASLVLPAIFWNPALIIFTFRLAN